MQLPKSFTTVTPLSKALAMAFFVILPFIGFYLGIKYQQNFLVSTSVPTYTKKSVKSVSLTVTPEPTKESFLETQNDSSLSNGWMVYKNLGSVKYELSYPQNWKLNESEVVKGIILDAPDNTQRIWIDCPRTSPPETSFPDPYSWENNEGGMAVQYFRKITVNGNDGQQFLWGSDTGKDSSGGLYTHILRKTNPVVCSIKTQIGDLKDKSLNLIESQTIYNQILNSFIFTD